MLCAPVRLLATFAAGMPQKGDFVQSRPEKRPLRQECLPRLQLECLRRPISCNRGQRNAPFRPNACRVCSWNAAERRFYAIAAGRMPLSAGTLAAFAAETLQNAVFMQSRPEKCPFWPECLPRLHLECRRRPISCNRGRRTPLLARTLAAACCVLRCDCLLHCAPLIVRPPLAVRPAATAHAVCSVLPAAFAAGVPQNADFVQSRPEKRPLRQECLPRLHLECRRTLISCNRGRRNAPFRSNACRGVLCAPVRLLAALCAPYRTPRTSPYALPRRLTLYALV